MQFKKKKAFNLLYLVVFAVFCTSLRFFAYFTLEKPLRSFALLSVKNNTFPMQSDPVDESNLLRLATTKQLRLHLKWMQMK